MGNDFGRLTTALAREDGTYYSTIDDIFAPDAEQFAAADWNNLRRTPPEATAIAEYGAVVAGMTIDDDPALGSSRSESSASDIPDLKGKISMVAQGAHLFPHNKSCAVAFGPAAELPLGQDLQNDAQRTRKRHRLVVGVLETKGSKRQKRSQSGLKHSRLNKVRIKGQKEYMDNRPCLLPVPLLSIDQIKGWKSGEAYAALVCIGSYKDPHGNMLLRASNIYADVLTDHLPTCSRHELACATDVLSCFTKGLAHSLVIGEMFDDWNTNPNERVQLEEVRNKLLAANQVHVPRLNNRPNLFGDFRVAKVRFDAADPALPDPPDPMLLAIKASIIWSWRNGEKLLPGCIIPEEEECSDCEMAHEYSTRLHEQEIRPTDHLKIARGLGMDVDETTKFLIS